MTTTKLAEAPPSTATVLPHRVVMRSAYAIALNGGVDAGLGVAYWVLATRLYAPATVGRNASLVAALLTFSSVAQLNYARSLSGLLPRSGRGASRLLRRVHGLTSVIGIVMGGLFLIIVPHLNEAFDFVEDPWWIIPGLAVSAAVWCIFSLQDTALASLHYAHVVPIENACYGIAKITGLWGLHAAGAGTWAIFASFMLPLVACIIPVNAFLFSRALHTLPEAPEPVRAVPRWVRLDFEGYLISRFVTRPLSILVLATNGAQAAAAAYMAFTIATSLDLLSLGIGNSLTAELARTDPPLAALRTMVFRTWFVIGAVSLALAAALLRLRKGVRGWWHSVADTAHAGSAPAVHDSLCHRGRPR
jgi:hypothetical protein